MSRAVDRLQVAIDEIDDDIEPRELRRLIDCLEKKFCQAVFRAKERGDHQPTGQSPVSWVAETCRMSKNSAADRLCVGEQLCSLPRIEEALSSGEIGYQAAAVICHLSEQVGEKRDHIDEDHWVGYAQRFSIKALRYLTYEARQAWDPDGFDRAGEEDYERRYLSISEMGRMYRLDGMLDPEGGTALLTAINALAKPLGKDDGRGPKQRRADALVELAHHAMSVGTLPKRGCVRPHITVTTTIEGLKGELGAVAAHLQDGMPISSKAVQRLACDGTLCRVLKADSMVIDVGRATRAISGSQRRGVNARYRTCCGPGCDRPVSMTSVHHIEFWGRGGTNNMPNFAPLCYYHHRLVHEGQWQIVKVGDRLEFIPPEREIIRRTRGPGRYWAA